MDCNQIKTAIGSISVDSAVDMARKMGYSEAQIAYARKCLAQKRKSANEELDGNSLHC